MNSTIKEDYEVITGFWDRGQFRAIGDMVRMNAEEAKTHVFAGCIKKAAVSEPVEAPSNAG
jgi:hypothetical protein